MTPPHVQKHLELSFSAGWFANITVGEPGAQGAVTTGMQGMGVSTPSAAAVAAATVGFAMELHIANGRMFTIGLLSMIFASGIIDIVLFIGRTFSVDGATPKLQVIIAPPHTQKLKLHLL
jgi:hypothetical protein